VPESVWNLFEEQYEHTYDYYIDVITYLISYGGGPAIPRAVVLRNYVNKVVELYPIRLIIVKGYFIIMHTSNLTIILSFRDYEAVYLSPKKDTVKQVISFRYIDQINCEHYSIASPWHRDSIRKWSSS
jgi:hypothetical protein